MEAKDLGLKKFYVDIYDGSIRDSVAKEGEVNSRGLLVKFLDKGKSIQIPGFDVYLYIEKKPADVYEEEAVLLIDGFYEIIFPSSIMKLGSYRAEIRLKKNGAVLATKTFSIKITEGIMTEGFIIDIDEPDVVEKVLDVLRSEEDRKLAEINRNEQYLFIKDMIDTGNVGKGDKGEPGEKGEPGTKGSPGAPGKDGEKGEPGAPGKDGSVGPAGTDGTDGVDGTDGINGADGGTGPEGPPGADGLKGEPGELGQPGQQGDNGKSVYEVWLEQDFQGSEQVFIDSLKGDPGPPGEDGVGGAGEDTGSVAGSAIGWLINIGEDPEENWKDIDMGMVYGDWELDYLVDGEFVYANVYEFGEGEYDIMVGESEMGPMMDMELYPVKPGGPISQVNVSSDSQASGANSQVNASNESTASGGESQVNASDDSTASGGVSQVNASQYSTASGWISQVNASNESEASGNRSQANASVRSEASGSQSQVNASLDSVVSVNQSQVNASQSILNEVGFSTAYGYGFDEASTANIKIHLLSQTGDIKNSGVVTSGHNFTDYAELFPNLTGIEQGYGLIQTIDGHGVKPANEGDQIAGVTSATAGVILGETPFSWQARWLKDEWGAYIMEDVYDEEAGETVNVPKENPEWDPEAEHLTRQDRPDEWTVVGLLGQVYVRLNEDVQVMDYVKPDAEGVGQSSAEPTSIRVMKITKEYVAEDGYKIGFCLLR